MKMDYGEDNMPKTKSISLYEFDELDETIQDDIISTYVQDLPNWWSDDIEERIKNEAAALGIQDFDFIWSGFWSQGDGLSFTGTLEFKAWLDLLCKRFPEWAKIPTNEASLGFQKLGLSLYDVLSLQKEGGVNWGDCRIHRHSRMYCHENTVNVLAPDTEVIGNDKATLDKAINFDGRVQACLNEWKNELCYRWYTELQEAYESFTARENIVEDIKQRELLYTSSGTIIDDGELV
tara:strand:+ start:143 stop:847 length:705 start_codon:yes stop_codon:yes gene_type:complete